MLVEALRRTWVQSLKRVVEPGERFEYDGTKLSDNLKAVETETRQEPEDKPKGRRPAK
ncbi:MAG TPA: hypothetical protein VIV09_05830 [Pseudolabrys sp.]